MRFCATITIATVLALLFIDTKMMRESHALISMVVMLWCGYFIGKTDHA